MVNFPPTPKTLSDVAMMVNVHNADYPGMVKEFLDNVIRDLRKKGARLTDVFLPIDPCSFQDEPCHLENPVYRAHLAGMAEYMSNLSGHPSPEWANQSQYFLKEPVFFGGKAAYRTALKDTPGAFRKRLLFTGKAFIKLFSILSKEQNKTQNFSR